MSAIIALDLGSKHVGVARSVSGVIAEPVGVWSRYPEDELLSKLRDEIEAYQAELVVIGKPTAIKGDPLIQLKKIASEIQRMGVKTVFVDEDYSTKEAQTRTKKSRKQIDHADAAAAQIILERYLDL